jgi:hypothetical protein
MYIRILHAQRENYITISIRDRFCLLSRVLRIFGPKRDEVTGEWRKLQNEELRDLYSSPSIIRIIKSRRMRREGHVARMGEKRNAYRLLVGKPEGKETTRKTKT